MKLISAQWFRLEKYCFPAIILIHLIPLWTLSYFVTHDGPAHLYNSNLITHLLFGNHPATENFYQFNPEIIPNWIAHILLGAFNLFSDAAVAEKIFLSLYVISFAFAFRLLVYAVNEKAIWASYLIFPFLYSFALHAGLYSFCFGLCVMLFVFAYWIRNKNQLKGNQLIVLSFCMALLYISHLIVFFTAFFGILLLMKWEAFIENKFSIRLLMKDKKFYKKISHLLIASTPPLIFAILFTFRQSSKTIFELSDFKNVAEWISDVRPLIALVYQAEKIFAKPLFYVFVIIFISALAEKVRRKKKNISPLIENSDGWLILALLMFAMYFLVPDHIISGEVIGIRFCLLGYLFLFLFFTANSRTGFLFAGAIASLAVSFLLINVRYDGMKGLANITKSYAACADYIETGSTLLPINYSENWMYDNITSYIGSEKEIIVLDNYEAMQVHFPLRWKKGRNPDIIGNYGASNKPCVDIAQLKKQTGIDVDYVLVMEKPEDANDSCAINLTEQLLKNYTFVYATFNTNGKLYKLKK